MTTPEHRVLEMVGAQKISAPEGQVLLAALAKRPTAWKVATNPFARLRTPVALAAAAIVTAASVLVPLLGGARFDGALDLHLPDSPPTLGVAALDAALALGLMALGLWVAARIARSRARLVDVLAAAGLARTPIVFVAVPLALWGPRASEVTSDALGGRVSSVLLWLVLPLLVAIVVQITWLYQGFKTASGLRGARLIGSFVGGLVVAEIVSKLVLYVL